MAPLTHDEIEALAELDTLAELTGGAYSLHRTIEQIAQAAPQKRFVCVVSYGRMAYPTASCELLGYGPDRLTALRAALESARTAQAGYTEAMAEAGEEDRDA